MSDGHSSSDTDQDEAVIPKEQDRATGDEGDLGVWPDDVMLNPARGRWSA